LPSMHKAMGLIPSNPRPPEKSHSTDIGHISFRNIN
jgi:hypothetical protein